MFIPGAHHGYDDTWRGEWSCCGGRFYSEGNLAALAETKKILTPILADTLLGQAPGQ